MGNKYSILEEDDTESLKNLHFYENKINGPGHDIKLKDMLSDWMGNHAILEDLHNYVQILFPIRESGLSMSAQPLSKHEASLFRSRKDLRQTALQSYKLMLDFYGLVLLDEKTGKVGRNPDTYKARYKLLNSSFHNYLRVTRICKWLGMIGLEHYKFHLLNHFVLEIFDTELLENADDSCVRYWAPTLRRPKDLKMMDALIEKFGRKVNRDGRDGYGDEDRRAKDGMNWSMYFYADELADTVDKDPTFTIVDKVVTAPKDPWADKRQFYEKRASDYEEEQKKKYSAFFSSNRSWNWDDDDDDQQSSGNGYRRRRMNW